MPDLPVYMDNNATTPCDPRVVEAMLPYFTRFFGNAASRNHLYGWQAEEAVAVAREQVAALIGASPEEIIFTSGATEADNLALKGAFDMYRQKGNHIITVETEHKAVLDTCLHLEKQGAEITYLPVDVTGLVDLSHLRAAIRPSTLLIAVMYANNETGTIQPVAEIGRIAAEHNIPFFTDAVQAAGKIPVDVKKEGIAMLALSAHKMYGPKGAGALYVSRKNPRIRLVAQMDGGGHEKGMRSGTLNVPGIVGLGAAATIAQSAMATEQARLTLLRDKLETNLLMLDETRVNGNILHRLPHVTNLSFGYTESEGLMMSFNRQLAVSSGSACSSASITPSHVLKSMGLSDSLAHASLRFSLGRFTTAEEVDDVIRLLTGAVKKMREMNNA